MPEHNDLTLGQVYLDAQRLGLSLRGWRDGAPKNARAGDERRAALHLGHRHVDPDNGCLAGGLRHLHPGALPCHELAWGRYLPHRPRTLHRRYADAHGLVNHLLREVPGSAHRGGACARVTGSSTLCSSRKVTLWRSAAICTSSRATAVTWRLRNAALMTSRKGEGTSALRLRRRMGCGIWYGHQDSLGQQGRGLEQGGEAITVLLHDRSPVQVE